MTEATRISGSVARVLLALGLVGSLLLYWHLIHLVSDPPEEP